MDSSAVRYSNRNTLLFGITNDYTIFTDVIFILLSVQISVQKIVATEYHVPTYAIPTVTASTIVTSI